MEPTRPSLCTWQWICCSVWDGSVRWPSLVQDSTAFILLQEDSSTGEENDAQDAFWEEFLRDTNQRQQVRGWWGQDPMEGSRWDLCTNPHTPKISRFSFIKGAGLSFLSRPAKGTLTCSRSMACYKVLYGEKHFLFKMEMESLPRKCLLLLYICFYCMIHQGY